MSWLADLPIRRKLNLLALLSSALGLGLAAAVLISFTWTSGFNRAASDLETLARISADNSTAALAFRDEKVAREILRALKAKRGLQSACLYTLSPGEGALFAYFSNPGADCPMRPGAAGVHHEGGLLVAEVAVHLQGELLGSLRIGQQLQELRQTLLQQTALALAVFVAGFLVSLLVAGLLQRAITGPLLKLASVARQVTETGHYQLRVDATGNDEIGRLIADFNRMLGQVQRSDQQTQAAHDALIVEVEEKTTALQQLHAAQDKLVQSEKMAVLGTLVAGVAHEVNTPVGVGVSAASTLQEYTQQLRQQFDAGSLSRSRLAQFIDLAEESTRLILHNLGRAADLIQGFKQVAVDQSSDARRRFLLKPYLQEVLGNLKPLLRPHRQQLDCPEALWVNSYPGALAQIITNLVSNSVQHGYAPGQVGCLTLTAQAHDGQIELSYHDDGIGIAPEHQGKVFDPFFTTRRGAGGCGLGLHIVYNLVTQRLGGRIELHSAPGEGARFTLYFPQELT